MFTYELREEAHHLGDDELVILRSETDNERSLITLCQNVHIYIYKKTLFTYTNLYMCLYMFYLHCNECMIYGYTKSIQAVRVN